MKLLNKFKQLTTMPEYASAIDINGDEIRMVRVKKAQGISIDMQAFENSSCSLTDLVEKHRISTEVVTVSPDQFGILNKIIEKVEIEDDSYDALVSNYLVKGMDPDLVTLDTMDLGERRLISFIKNEVEEDLREKVQKSGLLLDRIGAGPVEPGTAFLDIIDKKYCGAILIVESKTSHLMMYDGGKFIEAESLESGLAHFKENKDFYMQEFKEIAVDFWEEQLYRPTIRKIMVISDSDELKSLIETQGYEVLPGPDYLTPDNAYCFSMAYNTLLKRKESIDHNNVADKRLKVFKSLNRVSEIFKRIILPAAGIIAGILTVLFTATWGANFILEKRLISKHSSIEKLIKIKKENRLLGRELRTAEKLTKRSTEKAKIIEVIAKGVPENTWLSNIRITGAKRPGIILEGVSKSESEISTLYEHLESVFSNVRLKFTEKMDKKAIRRKSSRNFGNNLIRFSMELKVKWKVSQSARH